MRTFSFFVLMGNKVARLPAVVNNKIHNKIRDFGDGDDRIDLSAFEDMDSLADLALSQTDRGLVIDLTGHGGDTLILEGYYDTGALTDADFIF